jgi:hypothetical protein
MNSMSMSINNYFEIVDPLLECILESPSQGIKERIQDVAKMSILSHTWKDKVTTVVNNFFCNSLRSVLTYLDLTGKNIHVSMPKEFDEAIQRLDFRDFAKSHTSSATVVQSVARFFNLNTVAADRDFILALLNFDNILNPDNFKNLKTLDLSKTKTSYWSATHFEQLKELFSKNPSLKIMLPAQGELCATREKALETIASLPDSSYVIWPSASRPGILAFIYKKDNITSYPVMILLENQFDLLSLIIEKMTLLAW